MDGDLITFIKNCKIFSSLEEDVYQALITQVDVISLKENHILFRQGDQPDYFYILVSGKLSAILTIPNSKPRVVGHIIPGEPVGELGSLSGEPRTLTIKATEDSELVRLKDTIFRKICRQYPSILFETLNPVVGRSQQLIQALAAGEKKKHIAIIPANETVHLKKFEENIKETLSHYRKVILLNDFEINSDSTDRTVNVDQIIADAEANNHIILYLFKSYETPLSIACWNKIVKIYVIAEGNTKPHFSNFTFGKLHHSKHILEVRRELILLYKRNSQPTNTQDWLNHATFSMHHNIRVDNHADYKRLLRFIRGKAVGLVFSGGGTKGWAHMGALRALLEAHTPIDMIGGTSIGALIAGLYSYTENYEETLKKLDVLIEATRKIVSLFNVCWPAISLFNCEQFTIELQRIFGSKRIENMWLPMFLTTCNLGLYREVVHHSGLIWESCRGSVAVPGLVPPMVINGEVHIDGGVINNLPVNIMRDILGPEGKIIAVELVTKHTDSVKYNFPPTLTFRQAFLAKIGLGYKDYKFPPFLETFLQSLLVGSSVMQTENSLMADLLINPDTSDYSMIKVNKKQKEQLLELGYDTAFAKLSTWGLKK